MMVANITDNDIALVIATKHEMAHPPTTSGGRLEQTMDLYNNTVGRSIGAALKGKSQDEIAQAVQRAVTSGQMLMINMVDPNDDSTWKLTWSDGADIVWVNDKPYRKEDIFPDGGVPQ